MKPRVLILINGFIPIYNMRKEVVKGLLDAGYDVYISIPDSEKNSYFRNLGCHIVNTFVDCRGANVFYDTGLLLRYIQIIRKVRPLAVLSFTIKPNIYGAMASRICRIPHICNITGVGSSFINKGIINSITKVLYKLSIKYSYKVYFQNTEDRDQFLENRLVKNNWDMLPGSGVNLIEFPLMPFPADNEINFIYFGRILTDKGVDQYFECAEYITNKYDRVNFYVAGFIEEKKKYTSTVQSLNDRGVIKYMGFVEKIGDLIQKCHCSILPSFREGMPNVLLESAAMGRACIASNIAATREIIAEGINGYLFEVKNSKSLIEKVEKFISLPSADKVKMGESGRNKMERVFDRQFVVNKYLADMTELNSRQSTNVK